MLSQILITNGDPTGLINKVYNVLGKGTAGVDRKRLPGSEIFVNNLSAKHFKVFAVHFRDLSGVGKRELEITETDVICLLISRKVILVIWPAE